MKIKIETPICKTISYYSVTIVDDDKETTFNFENESSALSFLNYSVDNFLSAAYAHNDDIIYQCMFPLVCGYRTQIIYRYNGIQPLKEFNVVMSKKFLALR